MNKKHAAKNESSKREQARDVMLEEALARPSVREFMEVFQNWQKADQGLNSYRLATKQPQHITTTDHATIG